MFIVPINRDNHSESTPWMLILLLIIEAAVFFYTPDMPGRYDFFRLWGFIPQDHRLLTVFSSIFLHADFWHLAGNAWFFWMFGKKVESQFGKLLFVPLFLACGAGGTVLHYAFNMHSMIPCVGASGAISGMAGCYFVLFPRSRFDLCIFVLRWNVKTIETRTYGAIGAWIGEQALLGLITQKIHVSGIAYWAHIGGFVSGVVLAIILRTLTRGDDRETREYLIKAARSGE